MGTTWGTRIPFLKFNIEDFLRYNTTDIITMLTALPSTTAPSLQTGDPIRNELLQLKKVPQRVEHISEPTFTKLKQDPTPASMFTKTSKDPNPDPMFTQQQMQQFTNKTPIPPQRVQ